MNTFKIGSWVTFTEYDTGPEINGKIICLTADSPDLDAEDKEDYIDCYEVEYLETTEEFVKGEVVTIQDSSIKLKTVDTFLGDMEEMAAEYNDLYKNPSDTMKDLMGSAGGTKLIESFTKTSKKMDEVIDIIKDIQIKNTNPQ